MSFESTENSPGEPSFNCLRFNDASFEAFFKELYPQLCVYCRFKYGYDIHLAEDIVNAGFMKLWEVRKMLSPDISPKSYLYKIIDNRSLNILKHEKVKQQHVQYLLSTAAEGESQNTFDSVDLKQLRTAIETAISELPEQMRRIFELSRYEGFKYTEIGKVVSAHGANIVKDKNRYYLFGEAHTDTSNAFAGFNYYSSADLYNWTFEGVALPVQDTGKLGLTASANG